ncbi:hypothetical protein CTI12_AA493030 [Artemisia annua]|uniref:Uncharacterized protein n=1 Tax=Artemisia annua TaxID=35608 RepID=A0A2U1KTD3_ARTAN|nr:hypothetical protein CTI12_AA493030 [Artemisia annua]
MGNCCGGSQAEQDNASSVCSTGASINAVKRRGKFGNASNVWKKEHSTQRIIERTFYSFRTSQEHNQQWHPKFLQFCHNCNAPYKKPKDRQKHEDTCQM